MTLTGKQKAALLLMSLDAATAAQMVKGLDSKIVEELAVELAYMEATGYNNGPAGTEITQQFYNSLSVKDEFRIDNFLNELLIGSVGEAHAKNIQQQIQNSLHKRDPFIPIRSADSKVIASILNSEHPQAIAVILSELPAKKSSEVLSQLNDEIRQNAVSRMTGSENITAEAKIRIAETVRKKLAAATSNKAAVPMENRQEQSLRKVAVILRNLSTELRDGLLTAIRNKDKNAGDIVANLMIVWEDLPRVSDRSLQQALRGVDSRKMALALHKTDESISAKIKANISERAVEALAEEASLMSSPKKDDIEAAREEIVQVLREMNQKGELSFIEE